MCRPGQIIGVDASSFSEIDGFVDPSGHEQRADLSIDDVEAEVRSVGSPHHRQPCLADRQRLLGATGITVDVRQHPRRLGADDRRQLLENDVAGGGESLDGTVDREVVHGLEGGDAAARRHVGEAGRLVDDRLGSLRFGKAQSTLLAR